MKKRDSDYEMPIGKITRVKDFLPPPGQLVRPNDKIKITIELDRSNVEFFKAQATKYHTKYQKMIRELLDQYVAHNERISRRLASTRASR